MRDSVKCHWRERRMTEKIINIFFKKKSKFRSILNCLQEEMNDQGIQYKIKWYHKTVKLFSQKLTQVLPEMSVNVLITPF